MGGCDQVRVVIVFVTEVNTNFVTGNFAIATGKKQAGENDTLDTKHGNILTLFEHLIRNVCAFVCQDKVLVL